MSGRTPHIACIVLAAGRSTRMGSTNKLLADIAGKSMVRRVTETACASSGRPVLVVTGHMAGEVAAAVSGLDVGVVANPEYASGLASSLKTGIKALPRQCEGALIVLGDMPRITAGHLDRLIGAFRPDTIVVPVRAARYGNPVLWPAKYFPELLRLEGDAGAKRLLGAHSALVREIDLGTDAIFADVDTPDELARMRQEKPSA